MWLMILGLACIVQPWSMFLHRYALAIILIGLVAFIFFIHIKPLPEEE
jgi:preprotein translocase subunit Sss1